MPRVKPKAASQGRKVLYPEVTAEPAWNKNALTADKAAQLLGWQEVEAGDYLFKDVNGKKIRCANLGMRQRPFTPLLAKQWMHEILGKPGQGINPETGVGGNWQLTGESLVIGRTGLVIEGQHRLIGLVLAGQQWTKEPAKYPGWKRPPVINGVVVYGISESVAVVNVMNTGKPRTLADALVACGLFTGARSEIKRLAKMAEHAVNLLWLRTGAKLRAFAPRRSHAESLAFIEHHPRLLDSIKHIATENEENQLNRYITPGYASALLYLMATSATDPAEYKLAEDPSEDMLDMAHWDRACDYFTKLAGKAAEVQPVRDAVLAIYESGRKPTRPEQWAIICQGWNTYLDGKITSAKMDLDRLWITDELGIPTLVEHPSVGGIDLGNPEESQVPVDKDPTPKEIADRASEIRNDKTSKGKPAKTGRSNPAKKKRPEPPKLLKASKKHSNLWAKGDVAWVCEWGEEPWLGQLTCDPWSCDDGKQRAHVRDKNGADWEVAVKDLKLNNPNQRKSRKHPLLGTLQWVNDPKAPEPWLGRVLQVTGKKARLRVEVGFQGAGTIRGALVAQLSTQTPVGAS